MKKIILFASALASLFLASCQRENLEPVAGNGQVTFTVEAPAALQTRAIADGLNVNELIYEVWLTNDNEPAQKLYQDTTPMKVEGTQNRATLTLDLVNDQKFTVLFWAQVKEAAAYNTTELKAVSYAKTEYLANDESLAAFYGVAYVDDCQHVNASGDHVSSEVTLRRPFAQLNIGTLTQEQPYKIEVKNSSVIVSGVNTEFNVATGEASEESQMTFAMAASPSETLTVNEKPYRYAGMNYLFESDNVEVEYNIETSLNGSTTLSTVTNTISSVPLKENYRTNIIGNLLTSKVDYEIVVDADFEANDIVVEGGQNFVSVSSAKELVAIAEEIEAGNEVNIMLGDDIDLSELVLTRATESNWTPIGTPEHPFTGTFNGNGYTIKNLALVEAEAKEGKAYIGFFGYAKDATIKNVTFENVYINIPCLDIDHSQGHIGAVAGSLEGTSTIENVTVKGDITVYATQTANGASRVAVVAGGNTYGDVTMKNVHVIANEGSSLIANNNTGALAGQLQGKMYFENCSSNIDVTVNKFFAGGLVGIAAGDSKFVNCHTTGDVAVVAGREGRHNDEYRVGGIAGGWADGKTMVCTLTNCSYTGNVSGTNADGSEASPLDYMGYVGRGYTLTNCEGSTVIIDGVNFVQKGNSAPFGNYEVNGALNAVTVNTVDELNDALGNKDVTNIVLGKGEFGTIVAKSNKTIVGSEYAKVDCVNLFGADNVTIKNIKFDAATAKLAYDNANRATQYANIITGDKTNSAKKGAWNLVIEECEFVGVMPNAGAAIALADYYRTSGFSGNITIKNCIFDLVGANYEIYGYYTGDSSNGHGDFVLEGNTFKSRNLVAGPIYLGRYASSVPVVVKDNTFEVYKSLDSAMYVQDHSSYGVSIDASGNTFAN